MLPFLVSRASTNGTGTGVSPGNMDPADTSCSGSCAYNLTVATTKTVSIHREAANILSGFHYVPTPEARPIMANGAVIVVRLETAPTNTLSLSVNAVIEEEG